ncbi:MAG: PKD domain-containing protein [Bacteroidota bacterium]
MKKIRLTIGACLFCIAGFSQTTIISYNSSWKYLDNGSNAGTAWRATLFNDASWASGLAQFGYGDGDETTVVSYGSNSKKKYVTTYFRKQVSIANPAAFANFTLNLKRDDGAVVYVNGTEVFRSNMPTGSISSSTKALGIASDDGATAQVATIAASSFVAGNNVIAVEVHIESNGDADLSFDLQLLANPLPPNQPPVANAGSDQSITLPTSSVNLSGSGSADSDGIINGYAWSQVSGPSTANISSPSAVSTGISGLVQGVYIFRLTVTDDDLATSFDNVQVTVNAAPVNIPPSANAGVDQTITLPASAVTVNGSGSSDPDGTITVYAWSQVSGPSTANISNPSAVSTGISGLVQGVYTFRLTVTDDDLATSFDDVQVTVNAAPVNIPPTANAGVDQTITLPASTVTVNGSGSSDPDGTITVYAWSQVSGPSTANINNPSAVSTGISGLVQGVYTFRLTITDNDLATSFDDIEVTVNAAPVNIPPVANSGSDQTITLPTNSVTVNGGGSSDPDGTINAYAWNQVSGPSSATIVSPSAVNTSITGLIEGTYTFRLSVTDNSNASNTDDMVVTALPAPVLSSYNVISYGNAWKYLDNGSDQGTIWRGAAFNDGSWASGPGQLGYGDGDEATVVSYGPNSAAKYITTYFRKQVSITNPSGYANFTLNVKRDDGIVMYVNGVEVYRNNMPTGTITYTSVATAAASDDGNGIQTVSLAASSFVNGTNTIAVEMHQNAGSSTDLSFDMELIANAPGSVLLTRGPYLQMGNGNAVTLRWRTDVATNSRIAVGTTQGTYPLVANNATVTTEHEVRITGLTPDTKYYYSFGSSTASIQSAASNYFMTAPPASATRKIRIAAYGDCGRNSNGFQSGTLSSYLSQTGSNPAEIMLLLGDNAYDAGTDAEYTSNFFNAYSSSILKNHVLFPSPGNHDYANNSTRQNDHNVPYYNIFTMPTAAECGGTASNTEAFYSYNWGNIHFLSLDSYGRENNATRLYDTLGAQVTWIKNDLNANTSKWTIAYWHHPPYTMGSHNSDSETELVNMRQNFIRILERYGVDMIICGHSHDYERSYLLKNHFGNEASFSVGTHAVSSSSAKYNGTANSCPYQTASGPVNHGTVYVVAGSAGADGGVQAGYPHNALPFSVDDGGMLYFEVEDNRLDAKFIRKDNVVADQFTIVKDAGKNTIVNITSGQQTILTASWTGTYSWSTGATTRSITVSPASSTSYTVTDGSTACLTDQFTVNVSSPLMGKSSKTSMETTAFNVYPTPVKRGESITISGKGNFELGVINEKGQQVKQLKAKERAVLNTADMPAGVYFIRNKQGGKNAVKKIIITD